MWLLDWCICQLIISIERVSNTFFGLFRKRKQNIVVSVNDCVCVHVSMCLYVFVWDCIFFIKLRTSIEENFVKLYEWWVRSCSPFVSFLSLVHFVRSRNCIQFDLKKTHTISIALLLLLLHLIHLLITRKFLYKYLCYVHALIELIPIHAYIQIAFNLKHFSVACQFAL